MEQVQKLEYFSPTKGEKAMTELMSHCFYCYPGGVRYELRLGANPNTQDASGYTALMWLCRMYDKKHFRERKRIFRTLVKRGASMSLADEAGNNILFHARTGAAKRFRRFIKFEFHRRTVGNDL